MYIDFLCDERHFFTLPLQGVIDLRQAAVKSAIVNDFFVINQIGRRLLRKRLMKYVPLPEIPTFLGKHERVSSSILGFFWPQN